MADLSKTLSKAARLVRKGRPMSALIAMRGGLKPPAPAKTRSPEDLLRRGMEPVPIARLPALEKLANIQFSKPNGSKR